MSPRKVKFDRFMVANNNGRNLKLARLTDAQFRAFIQGVLPIASEATPRGAFMVGTQPATPADIVFMAPSVSLRTARSTVETLQKLGILEFDELLGGEWVHDFDEVNPAPKSDPTNARRQAEWRARNAARNGVTPDVTGVPVTLLITPPEVEGEREGEREDPPPLEGEQSVTLIAPVRPKGNSDRDHVRWQAEFDAWVSEHFPGCETKAVEKLIDWVPKGTDPTPDALREVVETSPNFAYLLEPAA